MTKKGPGRLLKTLLLLLLALLLLLFSGLGWILGSEGGSAWLLHVSVARLLPALHIDQSRGRLWDGLQLQGLRYEKEGQRIDIDRLSARWRLASLLDRSFDIQSLALGRVKIEMPVSQASSQSPSSPARLPALPLKIRLASLEIEQIDFTRGEQRIQLRDLDAALQVSDRLELDHLDLKLAEPALQLQARGEVRFTEPKLPLDLTLNWSGELPQLGASQGEGKIQGKLTALRFSHRLSGPFRVDTRGELALADATPRLRAEGSWSGLRWPLQAGVNENGLSLSSDQGQYRIEGPFDALRLQLDAGLKSFRPRPVEGKLHAEGQLTDLARLKLDELSLDSSRGRLQARGQIGLDRPAGWQLELQGQQLDASLLGNAWNGELALELTAAGRLEAEGISGQLQLKQLDGKLRNYPFDARGNIVFAPDQLELRQLRILSGNARVQLEGPALPRLDLQARLDAPDLAQLWPGASGQLQGEARLRGRAKDPGIRANFQGQSLGWDRYSLDQLAIDIDWPGLEPEQPRAARSRVSATGLRAGDLAWRSAELDVQGTPDAQDWRLALSGGPASLQLALLGGLSKDQWRGRITRLLVDSPESGNWVLQAPVALLLGAREAELSSFCLTSQPARLCGQGRLTGASEIQARLRLERLPLQRLAQLSDPDLRIDGELEAKADIGGTLQNPRVQVQINPGNGRLRLADDSLDPLPPLEWSEARIDLDYRDQALQGRARLSLMKAGQADLQVRLKAPDAQGRRLLAGEVRARLPDLALLAAVLPQAQIEAGRLEMALKLGGSLEQPRLNGQLQLIDGQLFYPETGLKLEQLQLQLTGHDQSPLQIVVTARAGEGELKLDGEVSPDPARGWPLTLKLKGKRLTLVQLPDTLVIASPDLQLEGDRRKGYRIGGAVVIPEASLQVRELPPSAVPVSEDEVIVGASAKDAGEAARPRPGPPLRGEVDLVLDDKVHFSGFGLSTGLSGKLRLLFQPEGQKVLGQIDLRDGRYAAWGQDLDIEKGRLLFIGPADDPGIELSALRVSKDGTVKAYLEVSGSLRHPLTRVRTDPPTNSVDALSYLLSGVPAGSSQGMNQAALVRAAAELGLSRTLPALKALRERTGLDELTVDSDSSLEGAALVAGKYLTPDLYLQFVQGLFDPASEISLRYRLSPHLSVETRSGTTQSVELQYSREYD